MLAWPDYVLCCTCRIVDLKEFTALETEGFGRLSDIGSILLAEVWIFLVFSEVCDQKLASMTCLSSPEAFSRLSALPWTTSREHSTIRSLAGTLDLNVEDKINGFC